MKIKILFLIFCLVGSAGYAQAPLALQKLNYTENPVDIPNPDRGAFRGRWQSVSTIFGITPEVDHRIPVDASDVLYHGATLVWHGIVGTVEDDDIEETQFFNGQGISPNYVGGTRVSALPSIAFMGFDLCNFSSNAFIKSSDIFGFKDEVDANGGVVVKGFFTNKDGSPRTGKTQPLTPYALDYIRGLLQKVREGNGVAFVKFSYDGNGFSYIEAGKYPHLNLRSGLIFGPEPTYVTANNPSGMCDIPGHTDKDWIQYHIWQLKPIFHEYEDVIMCVKTGMLGPWGEMHSSPMSQNIDACKRMMDAYLDAVPASRLLLSYSGAFMAWYNATYRTKFNYDNIHKIPVPPKGSPEARMGVFSDSYASSYDNNGMFDKGGRLLSSSGQDAGSYDREKTLTWIYNQNTMCQGEGGIGDNVYGNLPGALIEAQQIRTTALNMRHGRYSRWNDFIYNEANVTKPVTFPANSAEARTQGPYTGLTKTAIFDPVYDGRTGLEYMRDRLGYRLVLREAKASEWVEQSGALRFEGKIQNVGFGNVVNRKNVWVMLKSKSGSNTYAALTNLDARDWLTAEDMNSRADNTAAWRDLNFSVKMSTFGNVPAGEYDIYLKINDPKETSANRRCIQFANHDIWNVSLGANLIGSTTVK